MKKMNGRYPEGYNGPKSGVSTPEEWALVRDYQAYKWIIDGTWNYSDFDNYLYSMAKMLADKIITYENLSK
jgi:hypothetical protein